MSVDRRCIYAWITNCRACGRLDISIHMKLLSQTLSFRMAEINEGLSPPEDEPQDAHSEMSYRLTMLFGSFIPEERTLRVIGGTSEIAE